jgi:hypothetical protein
VAAAAGIAGAARGPVVLETQPERSALLPVGAERNPGAEAVVASAMTEVSEVTEVTEATELVVDTRGVVVWASVSGSSGLEGSTSVACRPVTGAGHE